MGRTHKRRFGMLIASGLFGLIGLLVVAGTLQTAEAQTQQNNKYLIAYGHDHSVGHP